jgi:hypothetical protein
MAKRRTIDLLPEIFQTDTNRQFLSATLDQMIQEPSVQRIQGYVGRRIGPGVIPSDPYVNEPTKSRTDYQLEPGVIFLKPDTSTATDTITYPGMLDALRLDNGITVRQDRMFENQYYAYDPFVDLDKFSNYSQYFWLSEGPDAVDVSSTAIPITDDFTVTRGSNDYTFSGVAGENPILTLARGGTYNFAVNQNGHNFWIQTAPGVNGVNPDFPNLSTRDVLGVINNGEDNGTVQFNVPYKDAQNFYYGLNTMEPVDLLGQGFKFNEINNIYVNDFLAKHPQGIDGITELNGLTIVFPSRIGDADDGGWRIDTQFDPLVRTTPDRIGTYFSYDLVTRTVADRTSETRSFDLVTRTVPNQVVQEVGFDATVLPFDEQPFGATTNVETGVPDPLDGTPGTFDFDPEDSSTDDWGFDAPEIEVTAGPTDPLDGTPGTFDVSGFEEPQVLSVSGPPDPLDGADGSYDSLPYDQDTDIVLRAQRYSVWQIQYVEDADGEYYMTLRSVAQIPNLSRFRISYGAEYSSTEWWKDGSGFLDRVPPLSAVLDELWYQDSTNPDIFGLIRLVDVADANPINVDDIVGQTKYTSPNGVIFTNGLKIKFRGPTNPVEYQNQEFYVEGVGTGPGNELKVGFVDGEAYFGPFHVFENRRMTGAEHSDEVLQQYIYDTLEESIAAAGSAGPLLATLGTDPQPGVIKNNGIKLIPVTDMVTPETYTLNEPVPYSDFGFDVGNFDATLNAPLLPDYITMSRASPDQNPWSRSNRWFHKDVIAYSAELNNSVPVYDNEYRAQRPIIEFRAGLKLWNFGSQSQGQVNVIDFLETDALSNINGQIGYGYDGYEFVEGTRVVFASDRDREVRNRIYRVTFVDSNDDGNSLIRLVAEPNGIAQANQTLVCLNGVQQQGQAFWFDGNNWILGQQKTSINQSLLFDVFDSDGISFGNQTRYPSNTFVGNRLFGYRRDETATVDSVLGFGLTYQNIENIGDIVFENFLYTENFLYIEDNASIEKSVGDGYVRQYLDRVSFLNQIGWQPAQAESRSRQVFRFNFTGADLVLDVPVLLDYTYSSTQMFVEGVFYDTDRYTVSIQGETTRISFVDAPPVGSLIELQVISDFASELAYYQIPINLENNPLNLDSTRFTLGGLRNHYDSIGQNLRDLEGPINGANNSRDLGNILRYGTSIVQMSAPMILPGVFLRKPEYDVFASIEYNSREYIKYKTQLLDLAAKGDYVNLTPTEILDNAVEEITLGKTESFPFYWSDMLPSGDTFTRLLYTVSPITTNVFDTTRIFDLNSSNFQGVLVFLNGRILTRNYDYLVPNDRAVVELLIPLAIGDVIEIREYDTTYGSYVPNTPTKMGLYPAFKPEIFIDTSYAEPTAMIRGHDGSLTVAFGDFRDDVLLQFETRIFNNIKINTPVPLKDVDVIPGQFRDTGYSLAEINSILLPDFLSWVGYNGLNANEQTYIGTDEFTYNYSQSGNRLTGEPLLGAWRGIYDYFFDTSAPTTRPWEMLGFSQRPDWWESVYGPAPYTSGNLVLWRDLERGYIADPNDPRFDARYARPGLTSVIPAGTEGQLLSPLGSVVGKFDKNSFRRSWVFGDNGPVEYAWRTSSSWPFAVMRLLALTKPAKFFGLFVDRDRYAYDSNLEQYLWNERYRLDPADIAPLYGNGVSRASYINWIIDYNQQTGADSTTNLTVDLANLDVRLCWRLAGFTSKTLLKVFTERSTPRGDNRSLMLPDESYQLLLYQNETTEEVAYSSVMVQVSDQGWTVLGYNLQKSYFEILTSNPAGTFRTIEAAGTTVRVPDEYTDIVTRVPYGYTFTSRAAVCDFLLSYGRFLGDRGFRFTTQENGYTMDWFQMANEFLYWSNQGWGTGSVINLNPGANLLEFQRSGEVVESVTPFRPYSIVLNQARQPMAASDLVFDRIEDQFRIRNLSAVSTINFANVRLTTYEHMIVLNNTSIFDELIYDPSTGNRQSRILVSGYKSADWDGTVNAPGFVFNISNVPEWQSNRKYTKGEIVLFKDEYWSASTIIQPTETFDYSKWIKSDYAEIQRGLLPNAALSSDELSNSYDIYSANLEQEVDLFSYGLIGFRPRAYMQFLDLNDVSQVNLYRQFLDSKGTRISTGVFNEADLGKEIARYDIYEYWAMLRNSYGATANRSYFELLLNEGNLQSNPSTIQVVQTVVTDSVADQIVTVDSIWKSSYKITSPSILPTTLSAVRPDQALPSAGYVNLEDVDITVFSLENNVDPDIINQINVGTTVWVANVNVYDWNIYRTEKVDAAVTRVSDNLNGTSTVTFDRAHDLEVGDTLIIKYFNDDVNGFYVVRGTPTLTTLTIDYAFDGNVTTLTGTGLGLTLSSSRVSEPSRIAQLPYATQLFPGVRAWVDTNRDNRWTVLQKTEPFTAQVPLAPSVPVRYENFGASISQGLYNLSALIGAPGYNPLDLAAAPGAVYNYVRNEEDEFEQRSVTELNAIGVQGYGNAIDVGNQNWAVAGASASNNNMGYVTTVYVAPGTEDFRLKQLLVPPDQDFGDLEFGYSVTMSLDEQWVYIGAPGKNKVYAYTRVDQQPQTVSYNTDGAAKTFNYSNHLVVNSNDPRQIVVLYNDQELEYATSWTVDSSNVILTFTPPAGHVVTLSRRTIQQLDRAVSTDLIPTNIVGSGSGARFTCVTQRGEYQITATSAGIGYAVGDVLSIDQDDIDTRDAPAPAAVTTAYTGGSGTTVNVTSTTGIGVGMTISGTGFESAQYVTEVVDSTTITTNLAPDSTPSGNLVFSHNALLVITAVGQETYEGDGSTTTFSILGRYTTTTEVYVNSVQQTLGVDYNFSDDYSSVIFVTAPLYGDAIVIDFGTLESFTTNGHGVADQANFSIDDYLATATDLYSFLITVNDQVYRPHLDYDLNTDSSLDPPELIFNTVPAIGSSITVSTDSHFKYVNTISVSGLDENARFGHSVTCNTNGSVLIVGAPNQSADQGRAYIFDRSVQRFLVTDPTDQVFSTVRDLEVPGNISVSVNGRFLLPDTLNIGGQFSVDVSNPANQTVTLDYTLNLGDTVEINTNQFVLVETVSATQSAEKPQYGYLVDQCINDCSLYISAPRDSYEISNGGSVEFLRNQARIYGTITTDVANPVLTIGDYIRINNYFVEVTGATVSDLADDINAAAIPNAVAAVTPDLEFAGDGGTKIFSIGSIYSDATSYTTVVYLDDVLQTEGVDYTYDADNENIVFVVAPIITSTVRVVSGRLTISAKNISAAPELDKLKVSPGTGSVFTDLGIETYVYQQTVRPPVKQAFAGFGESMFVSDDTSTLIIGAPNGSTILDTNFDDGNTVFDSDGTNFIDPIEQSGAVYSYDFLDSANPSITNPGQLIFGQQFVIEGLQSLDRFGASVDLTTGTLLIGAPGYDLEDSALSDFGRIAQFRNLEDQPAWFPLRQQQPVVDVNLLNTIFMYDRASGQPRQYFDFLDPLQGRLLGAVQQNIDYIGAVDPAFYNQGAVNNQGSRWGQQQVGRVWWNTANARFIDPNQDDIIYASRRWAQLFPGSTVDVYQWVVSPVPPAQYAGTGTVFSTQSYVVSSSINEQGFLQTQYYFWVTGISTIDRDAGKTLSIDTVRRYIENPRASGISYIAPLSASTLAIYNGKNYISAEDTVLHVEFDKELNNSVVHQEYHLIAEDRSDGFLTPVLYRKFLDSISGADTFGNQVPDPFLSPSERYGIQFRPRQSFFANRFLALKNYITQTNSVLARVPVAEQRRFRLLASFDPTPPASSGLWNLEVATYDELLYQDLRQVSMGYRYLVDTDRTNNGLWTIYEVVPGLTPSGKDLQIKLVQNYDTRKYWTRVPWYRPGYDPLSRIFTTVPNVASLDTLTVPEGTSVKVEANLDAKWEIYLLESGSWNRVAVEDGTIQISNSLWNYGIGNFGFDREVFDAQYFDQAPLIETRNVIEGINQELFIDDLAIERNRLLIMIFNFILSEQEAPEWLTKTSLIDVDHIVRDLVPFQNYRRDNQDFIQDYIEEVKPYHTQIKEFNLKYQGADVYQGTTTDFDVPAYWDQTEQLFVSPVLDNTGTLSPTSSTPSTSEIWQTSPWDQWYSNYLLGIEEVTVLDGGSGYNLAPEVIVTGDCQRQAVMRARINSAGRVVDVVVLDPGQGYLTTATITFTGGNGSGAKAVALMNNSMVRGITTNIKYDRYEYQTSILTWTAGVTYAPGSRVRYDDRVWTNSTTITSSEFDPTQWTLVAAADLSGVDRTMGFYVPTPTTPGLDLAQLITGVEYPGVQVDAPDFDQDTGFDRGRFDINPYDNISIDETGQTTYDVAILDAIYESQFDDPFLGTRPSDINVDGGAFVDTYSSHAPEELVPGASFDTLDMRVYTTAGDDWAQDGHGFPIASRNFIFDSTEVELSFSGALPYPVGVAVYNATKRVQLNQGFDYTVDWANFTVTILDNADDNNILTINVYGIGGGNQILTESYLGTDSGGTLIFPVQTSVIDELVVFVNGDNVTDFTYEQFNVADTKIIFNDSTLYGPNDRIIVCALGVSPLRVGTSWSTPVTEYVVSDGSIGFTLSESMSGTNPANLIVNKNGVRARPPQSARYIGDNTTVTYDLPPPEGYSQIAMADNDVSVYVDNQPLILGVDFVLDPLDDSTLLRTVTLTDVPAAGAQILISVRTAAQYWVVGNTITFQSRQGLVPVEGDIISITSFNDTAYQDILTQVFVGPVTQSFGLAQAFDERPFDEGNITDDPGSYDYSSGSDILSNRFPLGFDITDSNRLIVTLDGRYLQPDRGYTIDGQVLVISGPTINASQTVTCTSFTMKTVPAPVAFRIFQDMRGAQRFYRITPSASTRLAQPLTATADVIYVDDVTKLDDTNPVRGVLGTITINGERLLYRYRNVETNSVSGLRRGTAGTGAANHAVDSWVYDIGRGNLLPAFYQDTIFQQDFLANGTNRRFVTEGINLNSLTPEFFDQAVQIYVGGFLQTSGYYFLSQSPIAVEFDVAPPAGYQVTVIVRQGQEFYEPGLESTLQDSGSLASVFLASNRT